MKLFDLKQKGSLRLVIRALLILCFTIFCSVNNSHAQLESDDGFDTEDLVLAVSVEREILSSGIFAVQKNGRVYLPVGLLSGLLGFSVDLDLNERSVEGWLISEDRTFLIDQRSNILSYRGKEVPLPENAILDTSIAGDDMYVLKEVLDEVWPLNMEVDLGVLALRITPDEDLPYQAFRERKAKQERLLEEKKRRQEEEENKENYPFLAYPYQLWGKPSVDVSVSTGFDARRDEVVSGVDVGGVQDLAFASADYSTSFDYNGGDLIKPRNIRLRFRREDSYPGALPLGLKDVQWGDVSLNNRDLIERNLRGRGAIFNSQNRRFSNEFDIVTIDGVGTPGDEVELYINNQLLNFTVVDENGIYEFQDVQLTYGNNRIRTVLYGPQGQIDERIENYLYNANMIKRGEFAYSGGIVDAREDLISIDKLEDSQPRGIAANLYGATGVSENATLFGTANIVPDRELLGRDDVSRQYLSAGALVSVPTTFIQTEFYQEIDGGQAIDVRTSGSYKGLKVSFQGAKYFDFLSPDAVIGSIPLDYEVDLNVRTSLPTPIGDLGLEFDAEHEERENDTSRTQYSTRQSLSVLGTRLTNRTISTLNNNDHSSTTGNISGTTRFDRWRLRNTLGYRLFPDMDLTTIAADLRFAATKEFSTAFGFQRNFDSNDTIGTFQVTKDFEKFLGSFETRLSSQDGLGFLVRASSSFGPYAEDGDYIMRSDTLLTSGPVSAFIYEDRNYDGIFNDDDQPLPDTKIKIGRRIPKSETNENGYIAEMNAIYSGQDIDITVDRSSIDDPYLVASDPQGYTVYPRPGVKQSLIFPLIYTGAIDGTVRWANNLKPIGGLELQLMNSNGDIVQESRTAQDGYYTFERVKPGDYTIRTNPESGLNVPFEYVSLTPDDLFKFGVDIEPVDLKSPMAVDLDVGLGNDGNMNAKNILSLAKGLKSSSGKGLSASTQPRAKIQKAVQKVQANKAPVITAEMEDISKASIPSNDVLPIARSNAVLKDNIGKMSVLDKISARINQPDSPVVIQQVNVIEMLSLTRVALDVSAPIEYSIEYDEGNNTIILELPYSSWGAQKSWKNPQSSLLSGYDAESVGSTGTRLLINVNDDIIINSAGLTASNGVEQDRLYIDIVKK